MEQIGQGGESTVYRVRPGLVMRRFEAGAQARATVEWTVLRHLYAVGFPVPRPLGLIDLEAGAVGLQMAEIVGPTAAALAEQAEPSERAPIAASAGRLLRQLHSVDPGRLLLSLPTADLASLQAWIAPAAAAVLAPALAWLAERLGQLEPKGPVLLHNDWHGQNLMVGAEGALVAIDWSTAAVGDPRIDLGYATALQRIEGNDWAAEALLTGYGEVPLALELFEVQATLRRLGIFLSVLSAGPSFLGLHPELGAHLRGRRSYLRDHHAFLEALTGLSLPGLFEAVEAW